MGKAVSVLQTTMGSRVVSAHAHAGVVRLPDLDPLFATLATSLAAGAGRSVHPLLDWLKSRLCSRHKRRVAYQRLHVSLMQARMRIDILLAVQHSQGIPLNVVASLTGYDTAVHSLDRVATELPLLLDAWLTVETVGSPKVRSGARKALTALTALLGASEPAWYRPGAHRAAKAVSKQAQDRYALSLRELDRLTTADAAPRGGDRRSARRRCGAWAEKAATS